MKPNELTIRSLILGALITTVFTAANVYLGLKVFGLTFASSIPAAVISMAILSGFQGLVDPREQHRPDRRLGGRDTSVIIFVLPGLVIVGWWTGFPPSGNRSLYPPERWCARRGVPQSRSTRW